MDEKNKVIELDYCEKCGRGLKDEWKFCPFCKTSVKTVPCPICREEIKSSWQYCPFCKGNAKNQINKTFNDANDWLRFVLGSEDS